MDNEGRVFWGVPNIPKRVKDEFIWICKMEGKDYKETLSALMRGFIYDRRKKLGLGTAGASNEKKG